MSKGDKMDFKCHGLKAQWSVDYFVIELEGKTFCSLCCNTAVTLKEYNIGQQHQPKYSSK